MKIKAVEIVEMATDEVVDTIEINPPIEDDSSRLERIIGGLLINMNTDSFFVREVEA